MKTKQRITETYICYMCKKKKNYVGVFMLLWSAFPKDKIGKRVYLTKPDVELCSICSRQIRKFLNSNAKEERRQNHE